MLFDRLLSVVCSFIRLDLFSIIFGNFLVRKVLGSGSSKPYWLDNGERVALFLD